MTSDLLEDMLGDQRQVQRAVLGSDRDRGSMTGDLVGPSGMRGPVDPSLAFLIELGDKTRHTTIATAYRQLAADLSGHLDKDLRSVCRSPKPGITTDGLGVLWLALVQGGRRLRRASPATNVAFARAIESIVCELTVHG